MAGCSVVMVSYHTGPVLFASMKSVLIQEGLTELVLVDNGNPPDILARLQQMALMEPRLRIITGQGNVGYAKSCNLGVRDATGEYIVLMNSDCLLPPDALTNLARGLSAVPNAMLAGCRLVQPDGREQRGVTLLTPGAMLAQMFGLHGLRRLLRFHKPEAPLPDKTYETPAIAGACMCLRKSDYIRLFGLDEGFFLYGEDIDLCRRVQQMGSKVICVPDVRVTRMRSATGATSLRFREWQRAKGFMRYFDKHFRGKYIPGILALAKAGVALRSFIHIADGTLRIPEDEDNSMAARRLMILASGLAELPQGDKMSGRTVLVTDATGQIGLCVLRRLLASGASVVAVSRDEPIPFEHKHLRWVRADLTKHELKLDVHGATGLIHCAPLEQLPSNIDMLADVGITRIVAFGSTSIFAKALSKNSYERRLAEQLGRAEAAIAERCDAGRIGWTILRPTLIYGVGLDAVVTPLAHFIERFGFFLVYPPAFGRRQPVHTDDLAQAALLALERKLTCGRSYNLSGGEVISCRDMLSRLFMLYREKPRVVATTLLPFLLDLLGWLTHRRHINSEVALRMNDDLVFFHDEAKQDFGFAPRGFLTGGLRDIEGF